jgi:hypothetical protein
MRVMTAAGGLAAMLSAVAILAPTAATANKPREGSSCAHPYKIYTKKTPVATLFGRQDKIGVNGDLMIHGKYYLDWKPVKGVKICRAIGTDSKGTWLASTNPQGGKHIIRGVMISLTITGADLPNLQPRAVVVPNLAAAGTIRTVKVNANPSMKQVVKLNSTMQTLLEQSKDPSLGRLPAVMFNDLYADYVSVAKAEKVHPFIASLGEFRGGTVYTANVPINVDKLIATMTKQHCTFVRMQPNLPAARGMYPIIAGLMKARNAALKKAHLKPVRIPSAASICW